MRDSVWGCAEQRAAHGRRWQSQTRDSRLDKQLGTRRGPGAFLGGDAIPSPTNGGKQEPLTPPEGEGAVNCGKMELLQDSSKEPDIGLPHQKQEGLGLMVIRGPVIKAFRGSLAIPRDRVGTAYRLGRKEFGLCSLPILLLPCHVPTICPS